jgi:hypothetical protein
MPFFTRGGLSCESLTARYAVPAIFQWREFVQAGGLASYGTSLADAHRQVGNYIGKILQGAYGCSDDPNLLYEGARRRAQDRGAIWGRSRHRATD